MYIEALIEPLEISDNGIFALQQFFTNLTEWISHDNRHGCMLINLMAEDGGQNTDFSERAYRYRNRVMKVFRRALDQASLSQEISKDGNESRATVLMGLTLGLNIAMRACSSRDELDQMTKAIQHQIENWRL